ncbi:MAG: IS200/IS605 family transposase [Nitrospirae bacterium]|nr:MAG: IS200/IS605 family transposase [Nitrospirota bacterium]
MRKKQKSYYFTYHLLWVTQRKLPVLIGELKNRLIELINEKAQELNLKIRHIEIAPNYVYIIVRCPDSLAPRDVVVKIKKYTSNMIGKEFPEVKRRMRTLWTRRYIVDDRKIPKSKIEKFLRQQKKY